MHTHNTLLFKVACMYLILTSSILKIIAISIQRAYTIKSNIPLMWTPDKLQGKSSHTFRDAEQCGIQLQEAITLWRSIKSIAFLAVIELLWVYELLCEFLQPKFYEYNFTS